MDQLTVLVEKALSSPTALWVMLISGVVLFILMSREVVLWFFKLSTVLQRLEEIQKSLERLEVRPNLSEKTNTPLKEIETATPLVKPGSSFPLQH